MSSRPAEASPVTPALAAAFRREISRADRAERAYARFAVRAPARSRVRPFEVVRWVALGMLLGAGSLYAATGGPFQARSAPSSQSAPAVPKTKAPPVQHKVVTPSPSTEVPEAQMPAGETGGTELALPPAPHEAAPAHGAGPESWQRAARALRDSDLGAADDALARLAEQGSSEEREVVKLVRAQVLARSGQVTQARALLESVSRSATSAEHRAKAGELLRQLTENTNAHRSFDVEPHTK